MVTKSRNVLFRNPEWQEWNGDHVSPPSGPVNHHTAGWVDTVLYSESHSLSGKGKHDVGGNFHQLGHQLKEANFYSARNRTSNTTSPLSFNYNGNYYAKYTSIQESDFPVVPIASDAGLTTRGTIAISQVIPTNPLVGLATTLGELRREGIPNVVGAESLRARALRARNAGSEYLNVEFGWRPLVTDVLKLADAIINSDELMKKYERESGKLLHRTYTFPDIISSTRTVENNVDVVPLIKTNYQSGPGQRITISTSRTRTWFEGVFTYHLAPQGSLVRSEQLAAKRFGLRITPEVLWNLTPWTWAADWVTNAGAVVHNVSAFANDGLVMPWGYIMNERSIRNSYMYHGGVLTYGQRKVYATQELTTIRKQRKKATPFGFGLLSTSFTGRQWAILAALGLARSGGQLPNTVKYS